MFFLFIVSFRTCCFIAPYHHRGSPHAGPHSGEPRPVTTFHKFHLKDEVAPPSGLCRDDERLYSLLNECWSFPVKITWQILA